MMEKKIIRSEAAPGAIGPYNQAVQAGGFLFTAGQVPLDPATGELVAGGIREQTARVMENLKAVLAEAGLGFGEVVKATVFLADIGEFAEFNAVYGEYFEGLEAPARSAFQVAALPLGARVEIEMIAKVS